MAAIVNPAAGSGLAERRWRSLQSALEIRGISVTGLPTVRKGHATVLAREAVERGHTTIVAVGGDGTVHEIVNGLQTDGRIPENLYLGVVPAGTGMDFARNLGISTGLQASLDRILQRAVRKIDVGVVWGTRPRLFVNFAEAGMGAEVVAREAELKVPLPGRATFLLAALRSASTVRTLSGRVIVDGVELYDGAMVSAIVANGKYFGGGMNIAPHALPDDGLLDVIVLQDFTPLELLANIWKVYPGVHLRHPKVAAVRGAQVEIEVAGTNLLDLDGELLDGGSFRFSVLRAELQVLA